MYGQGMTTGCLEAVALGLSVDREGLDSPGLAPRYSQATAKVLATPGRWALVATSPTR
jgi:hypothetical protein